MNNIKMAEDEAKRPFLENATATDADGPFTSPKPQPSNHTRLHARPLMPPKLILFHISLVALYTFFSALTIYALRHDKSLGGLTKYTPTGWLPEADLHPVPVIFHDSVTSESVYAGPGPNNTIDAAWMALLESSHMRASFDELTLAGARPRNAVGLTPTSRCDGARNGEYLVQLDAFHELYCLKSLREYVYSSTYHAGRSDSSMKRLQRDVDQCVEVLRQRVMCAPDLSLTTFRWVAGEARPAVDNRRRVRECVDWVGLVKSLQGRAVGEEELRSLKNPNIEG